MIGDSLDGLLQVAHHHELSIWLVTWDVCLLADKDVSQVGRHPAGIQVQQPVVADSGQLANIGEGIVSIDAHWVEPSLPTRHDVTVGWILLTEYPQPCACGIPF